MRFWFLLAVLALAACEDSPRPAPSPTPGADTITGNERIGWDQAAATAAELATFRYLIYVDNVSSELTDVACDTTPGPAGFACSARLPPMSSGSHVLRLSSFIVSGGVLESARSDPFSVVVNAQAGSVGGGAPLSTDSWIVTTGDGVTLQTATLAAGLLDVTDMAVAPDRRVYVAERGGRILVVRPGRARPAIALAIDDVTTGGNEWGLLSLAVDPRFNENGFVYAVYTSADGFRLSRYRAVGDTLGDRAVLLDRIAHAGSRPAAAVRFGEDGKLYLALDHAGIPARASDMGSFNGKVLRMNADATTPADQRAGTPVFSLPLAAPRGMAWDAAGTTLWVVEDTGDVPELRAIEAGASGGSVLARYRLTPGDGVAAVAAYRGSAVPEFAGNLFIAARGARALLRVRVDADDSRRIVGVERLLKDVAGEIRSVAVDDAGALLVATESAIIRCSAGLPPSRGRFGGPP